MKRNLLLLGLFLFIAASCNKKDEGLTINEYETVAGPVVIKYNMQNGEIAIYGKKRKEVALNCVIRSQDLEGTDRPSTNVNNVIISKKQPYITTVGKTPEGLLSIEFDDNDLPLIAN